MTKSKVKPMYNIWQNFSYLTKKAWHIHKGFVFEMYLQIILIVAVAMLAIFLPAVVVEQIMSETNIATLILTVLLFSVCIAVLHMINTYIKSTFTIRATYVRMNYNYLGLEKIITIDYSVLEEKEFSDAKQKARDQLMGNSDSGEEIYHAFVRFGINLLGIIVYIILIVSIHPIVLLIVVVTAVLGTIAREYANKALDRHQDELAEPRKRMNYINSTGSDADLKKDLRIFGMIHWLREVFNANVKLSESIMSKIAKKYIFADVIIAIATFLREGIAYAYLIWLVIEGNITVYEFVLMFAAINGFSEWIYGVLTEYASLSMHSMNICHVRRFIDYPNKFNHEMEVPIKASEAYTLEAKNVGFKYSGADEFAVKNINLTIKAGEKLAVVGLNGAGKTTLVKLLCGFYDPTEGQILLNGQDIRQFNRDAYYALFTAVFQEFNILPLSIAENVSQVPGAHNDPSLMKKIDDVLRSADLMDKINTLPSGAASLLNTQVNHDAVELSGGQTQRLMLARALYKNAPILILDEPTAALDPIAENNLYEKYNALSESRTSVYISHRLASTRFCDRIILIEDQTIAEEGTHDALMQQGGKYAELFEIQSKYYQDNVDFDSVEVA